jgi:predicted ester cyclase
MSAEDPVAVVRRYFALVEANDLDRLADEVLAPEFRLHFDSNPEMDRDQAVGALRASLTAFPGITHDIQDQFGAGDRVATRVVARGRHGGDFMGMPPTGRDVEIRAIYINRVEDGRIVEQWLVSDGVGLLQQLGAMPPPG